MPPRSHLGTSARRALLLLTLAVVSLCAHGQPTANAAAGSATAQRPDSLFSTDYLRLVWDDTRYVLTEPARWTGEDWSTFGIVGGVTLASASLDHTFRRDMNWHGQNTGSGRFFRQWQKLGNEYSWVELAAFEGWGVLGDQRAARETAMDGLAASIIASGIVTPVLKYSAGRYRPTQTEQTFKFRPFSGHQSFPSGHSTQAFAIAAVIAHHYPEPWEQSLAYGSAALVAVARVQQNEHFVSDVVAGSAIGWAVGHAVANHNDSANQVSFQVEPWSWRNVRGLAVERRF